MPIPSVHAYHRCTAGGYGSSRCVIIWPHGHHIPKLTTRQLLSSPESRYTSSPSGTKVLRRAYKVNPRVNRSYSLSQLTRGLQASSRIWSRESGGNLHPGWAGRRSRRRGTSSSRCVHPSDDGWLCILGQECRKRISEAEGF